MDIVADITAASPPRLIDADNFRGFKVVVRGDRNEAAAQKALSPVAEWLGDDHVAVSAAAVRAMAGDIATTPEWEDGFRAMLAYAESKGWMVGDAIKAHIEWEA